MQKIKLSLLVLLALFSLSANAQENKHCGSTEATKNMLLEHPELKTQIDNMNNYLNSLDMTSFEKTRSGEIIIPLVFHIIHNNGPENISDAQVYDAVQRINDDYNNLNADLANTIPLFVPLVANCGYHFKLATKDPEGNCTNGIERIWSYKTYNANDQSKINSWNPARYLNIWVVNTIGLDGAAAYAYLPATANYIPYYDGILCLFDYAGATGQSQSSHQHTLSHEIGHYLNLQHTWGSSNDPTVACGDDGVGDTPETKGYNICNNLNGSFCNTGIIENVQNFMEYSYCSTMFTLGQKQRMGITLNSIVAQRKYLYDDIGLAFTGCLLPRPDCPPHAEFKANRQFTCVGSAVSLNALSWGDSALTHAWSAPQGTLTSATGINTQVSFTTPGWKEVGLTSTSNAGSNTLNKSNFIYVSDNTAINPNNYLESFEGQNAIDSWPIFNYFNNFFTWEISDTLGLWGNKCLRYKGFDNRPSPANKTLTASQDWDDIITPAYDLSSFNANSAYLSFWESGSTRAGIFSQIDDSLEVYYSTNCGSNWTKLIRIKGADLDTYGGYSSIKFAPSSMSQWKPFNLALPAASLSSSTYFKLRYHSGDRSNDTYFDNFSFGQAPTSIEDIYKQGNHLTVVPNPNKGQATVFYNINKGNEKAQLLVQDCFGKTILSEELRSSKDGIIEYNMHLPTSFANGMYFVRLISLKETTTEKFTLSR